MNWTSTRSSLLLKLRDQNDEAAWRRFDRLYGEVIVRHACQRGLQLADAEDVRQTVLLGLFRALPRFEYRRDVGRFRGYLGRAVANAILRVRTRPHQSREQLVDDWAGIDPGSPADPGPHDFEREWADHHLRVALESVRRTFGASSLRAFDLLLDGKSCEQAASELDMTVAAVRKIRQRVRERLALLVQRQVEEEERLLSEFSAPDGSHGAGPPTRSAS